MRVLNPSISELTRFIRQLDGVQHLQVALVMPAGRLFIASSPEGRMQIQFTSERAPFQWGYLMDRTQSEKEELEFLMSNGEVDSYPANLTVTREKSLEVATYFLEHGTFPKGMDWDGEMSEFQ